MAIWTLKKVMSTCALLALATSIHLVALTVPATAADDPPGKDKEASEEEPERLNWGGYTLALGGQYRVLASGSNFNFHPVSISDQQASLSFVTQRLRTWLNLYDADQRDHGVYIQLEIGHVVWGDDTESPKTYRANGEEVGIELRRGYLWYKPSPRSLLRAGVLDWHDRFGESPSFEDPQWAVDAYDSFRALLANSIWDFNVSGVSFDTAVGEQWQCGLGAFVLKKADQTLAGKGGALLFTGDVDRRAGSSVWGGSVYYLRDRGGYSYGEAGGPRGSVESSWDLWAGLRAHWSAGGAKPSLFWIWNTGRTKEPRWRHTGWAAKAATDFETSHGKLSLQLLYSTGNDGSSPEHSDEFRTVAQSLGDDFGAQSYWSLLGLSSPRGPSDVMDLGVSLQNRGLGLLTLQAGWERKLSADVSSYLAAGWLRSAEANPANGSRRMGVELLGEIHWSLVKSMGIDVGAAYLASGDFYKADASAPSPDDLYQVYLRYQLEF